MARKNRRKRRYGNNNEKATWENTAKEQPYLMPGTAEYVEYQEDLKDHDPFRPNDEWHDKLEQKTEDHSLRLMQKAEEAKRPDVKKRKYTSQIMKEAQFAQVKKAAKSMAEHTETKADDRKAARMDVEDTEDLVYNDGVTSDDYLPKALSKYM